MKIKQRIKLRIQGNPVKLDGTILEMSRDGSKLNVRFDGPMHDITLYRWSPTLLIDTDLQGKYPADFPTAQFWEVL